jgi:Ca2+-binding EF-hand superfamily protein
LSGGAAPERRLRQLHDGLEQIRKYINACEDNLAKQQIGKRPSKAGIEKAERALMEYRNGGIIVTGDFNSDGNTAVRKLLVEGCVDEDWREPQYPNLPLTSKRREHKFGSFIDAAELAYGSNVHDGDYEESNSHSDGTRPATYVVPNLASTLILPIAEQVGPPRTQFGPQIARGVAVTLNLNDWCTQEIDKAFEQVDSDSNGSIDEDEIARLLEDVYIETYGQQIEKERKNFFRGFGKGSAQLTKEQFIARLKALQQDAEGERKAFGLAKGLNLRKLNETEMDAIFEQIDLDKNGFLDEDEFQELLKTAYLSIYGEEIDSKRTEFFKAFQKNVNKSDKELTKEQFTERLLALHQELEGGRKGSELAEVRTDADVQKMIERFTPLLKSALDEVFHKFSSDGIAMTEDEVNKFLIETNDQLGRGGTFRHTSAIFERKSLDGKPAELTLDDWYGVFARELSEGKWWQVVYDLEVCGCSIRSHHSKKSSERLYQGWYVHVCCVFLETYLTFSSLTPLQKVGLHLLSKDDM